MIQPTSDYKDSSQSQSSPSSFAFSAEVLSLNCKLSMWMVVRLYPLSSKIVTQTQLLQHKKGDFRGSASGVLTSTSSLE